MEHIRLIHFPNCRMVTSGTGFFGDENFTRFEKLLAAEARTTPYPMDFLTGNEHGMEWLYLYREGMDTFGRKKQHERTSRNSGKICFLRMGTD